MKNTLVLLLSALVCSAALPAIANNAAATNIVGNKFGSYISFGNRTLRARGVKRITSVAEASSAMDKVFAAYSDLMLEGKTIEYNANDFYYEGAFDGNFRGISKESLLSFNLEAGLDYFRQSLLAAEDDVQLLTTHKDLKAWREKTFQQAEALSKVAEQRLEDKTALIAWEETKTELVLAGTKWIMDTLLESQQKTFQLTGRSEGHPRTVE